MNVLYTELNFTCDRELALMVKCFEAYRQNRITVLALNHFGELKKIGFNPNSGYVWLEDKDGSCIMLNGNDELDLCITTPYGVEGFMDDIQQEYNWDELHPEDKEYLEGLLEDETV